MRIRDLPGISTGPPPAKPLFVGLNGRASTSGSYSIGIAAAGDRAHWQTQGIAKLFAGSGWEAGGVKDPSIFWDPVDSQFVMLYGGYDVSTVFQIGRATANPFNGDWTKYASNPVIAKGASGSPDFGGCEFPVAYLDGTTLRVWYVGFPTAGNNTAGVICYAESTDYGQTFTKYGKVIDLGASGAFNDGGSFPGCVYKSGSTWYVYMMGFHNPGSGLVGRSAYCTTTNPQSAASYASLTQLSNYTGNITVGGKTWQSNQPRGIIQNPDGTYTCWVNLWNPTDTSTILESCAQVTSPDLTSWASPSALMLPFDSWSTVSAENPSVIVAP